MKLRILIVLFCLSLLSGCCSGPHCFSKYCSKDYWNDSDFDIFGRKNCVGRTGNWIDQENGHSGYFCVSPNCKAPQKVTCQDTCNGN